MKSNNKLMELSYYGLSLLSYLKESHPEKVSDITLIETRADIAAAAFENAIKEGYTQSEAEELANQALLTGLHYSKYDTIVNILWDEFPNEVAQERAKEVAIKLLPYLEKIFEKYPLSDDFTYSSDYDLLYTELVGCILIYFEEYGI